MRRSVVDEVFEAHEAHLLGQETSGLKSKTADLLQRRTGWGWVTPGLRERLVDFYDAAKYYPYEQLYKHEIGAPSSIGMDPKVERAWLELVKYFHANEEALRKLYPRMKQTWMRSNDDPDSLYALPLKSYYEWDHDLVQKRRHLLAVDARAARKHTSPSGRTWANRLLASWAPQKERVFNSWDPRPAKSPSYSDGYLERYGRRE